ncbi:MAG TPA: BACON domain-containing carbohydrate-binding protein [Blastocatellia bacterium]|nr:BACON domain-containing carbohydrate-binding protein [Blastocatellia bacterium]
MSTRRARSILAALFEFSTRSRQRREKLLVSICLVSLLAAGLFSLNTIPSVIAWGTRAKPQASESGVTVGKSGEPFIKLRGSDLPTGFTGPAEVQAILNANQADPISIAAMESKEGGTKDLVVGYSSPRGNVLAFMFGNVDSIYPNSPEAQRKKAQGTFTDAPFQRSAKVISCPARPDFIAAGNFTNRGVTDVVVASLKSDKLFLLPGNDKGDFESSVWSSVVLPGSVTAFKAGEINRLDGLMSLAVATSGSGGNRLLVFQDPRGALNGPWESFSLGGEATSIVLTQVDRLDSWGDIGVSFGSSFSIIHGRDRKLTFGERTQRSVPAAVIEQGSFPFEIASVVAGKFTSDDPTSNERISFAMLATDGTVHLLSQNATAPKTSQANGLQGWTERRLGAGAWPGATTLVAANLSSLSRESIVVVDRAHQLMEIVNDTKVDGKAQANLPEVVSATLNVAGGAGAVLPMRMTSASLDGLVVMRSGHSAATVVLPLAVMTFTVTNTLDSGAGSLRQAIIDSNNNSGADTISFAIGSGPQTISPTTDLPPVNDPVTIDATTQPGFAGTPLITLNGALTGSGIGLKIGAGSTTVRGLVINNCSLTAVEFILNGGDHLEGCYLGTDSAGSAAAPNFDGIKVFSTSNNVVGGTTVAARNVISGNSDGGVDISGVTLLGNTVQGNFIGTNAAGTASLPNVNDGVYVNAKLSKIGGTTTSARNIISGNSGNGVLILNDNTVTGTLIQGNYIGLDATGTVAVPNALSGVRIRNTSNHTVGGALMGGANLIQGNTGSGVYISDADASGNLVHGNIIGSLGLGNGGKGVRIDLSSNNQVGGTLAYTTNIIWYSGEDGISVTGSIGNNIRRNFILRNGGLGIDLGDDGVTANDLNDPDGGANNLLNFPLLAQSIAGPNATAMGTYNGTPNATFLLEFFVNSDCNASGNGEGQTLLGETMVTTNASGNASFNVVFAHPTLGGQVLTATASDASNNTSEFSPCALICGFSIAPPSQSFTPAGGTGSIAVTTQGSCAWTAVPSAAFVTITSGASGTGSGTVNFSVAQNNSTAPRTATITIQDQVFNITQAGCSYAIAPPSQAFTSAGGTGSITVTTTSTCPWTAVPSAGFVTITSGATGTGNGTVNFSVAGNVSVNPRSATITIVDQVFNITEAGCTYAIAPPNQSFTPAGGTGSITVTTTATCPWTAVSSAGFVTVTSGASGTGNGTVNFSVAQNNSTSPRSATITVVDQVFTVNQAGCSFAIAPPNQSFTSAGGTGSITVTTTATCPWTAVPSAAFVTITSGASGTGNGTVNFSVAANPNITPRSATITVVDQVFTVNQAAAPCTFAILPTSQTFTATGGTGSVGVTAPTGCLWMAVSNDGFITVTSGASGNGNGTVNYSVAAKGDVGSRMGTITIAGNTFTVTQSGVDCLTFTIMPTSQNFPIAGGTGSVSVTTGGGCPWMAVSNAGFITITSGSSGSGNGTVNYSVAANGPSSSPRSGTMTIAGQTFTVNQDGACPLSISPSGRTFLAAGGTGDITVTTDPTCMWTAVKDVVWITITSGSSGTGNGTVKYSVAPNGSGVQRIGTVTVSGKVHTVKQN